MLVAGRGQPAGPTLAEFSPVGSRACRANFSAALKKLDIVWTPDTVAKLFEVGPAAYTPGTKMPEQTIGSADERTALVKFLEKATKK
jgi:cytochrome c